ncbi:MAG: acylphosphatase [Candidatus Paceibacterota bacterium]
MVKQLECEIFGRVQMVMFRDFVRRQSVKLGLSGFVQNTEAESVKVLAQGEEAKLNQLLTYLRKGPALAKVERISETWSEPKQIFDNFEIIYRNLFDRL